jgi:hypothetical protein
VKIGDLVQGKPDSAGSLGHGLVGVVLDFDETVGGFDPMIKVQWSDGRMGWMYHDHIELVELK